MRKIVITVGVIVGIIIVTGVVMTMMAFSNTEIVFEPNSNEDSVVQPVKFGHSNVYFIRTDNGHILVDGGMPGDTIKLDEVFATAGVEPNDRVGQGLTARRPLRTVQTQFLGTTAQAV